MKLEVGKKYINRKGDIVEIVEFDGWRYWSSKGKNYHAFLEHGFWIDPDLHRDGDLVEEYYVPLTFGR